MNLATLNILLYYYISFVCLTSAIKVPTEWIRNSANVLANYKPNDEIIATGETRNRDSIDKAVKLNIEWPQYKYNSENLQKQKPKANYEDVEIIRPAILNDNYQKKYFQYTAPKPQFAVQVAQFHGVPNPHQHYKATPVAPHTPYPKPSLGARAIYQNPSPVFKPINKYIAAEEQLKAPLSPISSNYEIFHPYKVEKPYLKKLSNDPAYKRVKQDVKINGKRLKKYEEAAGNVDIPEEDDLKSPDEIDHDKFGNYENIPTEYEKYSEEKIPIYYVPPKNQHIPHQYLNKKLKYPSPHNYAKTKPVHYAPLRHYINNLKQQQGVSFGDENDQYPEIKPHHNHFAEPPDGYDIYQKEKQNYETVNKQFNKDFNAFAADQGSDGATHRTAPRDEQRQDYKNNEQSQDNEEDFIPIKMYAQVRKTETTKHLPREEAYNEAETPDEILNAPRLREAVKSTKAQTVYTEEGYEDSAYDHAGHQKHASNEEGHGGYLKENAKSAGKFKTPSVSDSYEDGGGSASGKSVSSGNKWKDLDEDSVEHDDTETSNEDEGELSESQKFDLNEAGSETKFVESPKKPKTSLSMTKDSEKTTIKEANDGMLVSTKSQHLRLSNDKNLAGDRKYTKLPTKSMQGKVKHVKPTEEQASKESITKITKVLPRSKRGTQFEIPSFSLKNTYLTEDDILAISKQKIGVKEDFNRIKYPYYNSKIIDRNSPLRYAENIKNIPIKSKGGTEFYDSRSRVKCPEVEPIIEPVPDRIKSFPAGENEDTEDYEEDVQANDNESHTREANLRNQSDADFSSIKKQPRLRGLGDSIDCFKTKYFDENPLDSPFFEEEVIEDPEPLILPPIPHADKNSNSEQLEAASSDEVPVVQLAEPAELAESIERATVAEPSENTENTKHSEKYIKIYTDPSYLELVLKVINHKLAQTPKSLHSRVYRNINDKFGQANGGDIRDILRDYYTLSDEDDGYTNKKIHSSNVQDDEDSHKNTDSLDDINDGHWSKSLHTKDNEIRAEKIGTSSDDDDGHVSKDVAIFNAEIEDNKGPSSDDSDEDGDYENKKNRYTPAENDADNNKNIRSSGDDNDEFVPKYVRPSSYEYHEGLNKSLRSSNEDSDNYTTKHRHQADDENENINENIRTSSNEDQDDFNEDIHSTSYDDDADIKHDSGKSELDDTENRNQNIPTSKTKSSEYNQNSQKSNSEDGEDINKNIHSSSNDNEEYKTTNVRQINNEDDDINKNIQPFSDDDQEDFSENIHSSNYEDDDNIKHDSGTSKFDAVENRNQNIPTSKTKSSEYINSQKSNSEDNEHTNKNIDTSNGDDYKDVNKYARTSYEDDDEDVYQNVRTLNKEDDEDTDYNFRTSDRENAEDISQSVRELNQEGDGGMIRNVHTSNGEDYENLNQNVNKTNGDQNIRTPSPEDEEGKKQNIRDSSDDYDGLNAKNPSKTNDNDNFNKNLPQSSAEKFYKDILSLKEKHEEDINEYIYSPNLEYYDDSENVIPINTPSDNATEVNDNIDILSIKSDSDKETLKNNDEKLEKDNSKDSPSKKNSNAKKPSYLSLVLKVLSPDIDFRSLNTYSDIIENIRLLNGTLIEKKHSLDNKSDSTAENITQLPKIIRRKRSTEFKYEPYKVIENYQMDTQNKMKQTTISPLLKRMLSTRVSNIDKTQIVKRDTVFKPVYKYIDKMDRRAARGLVEPDAESLVIVDVDPRRGEPRYELLTPANHKSQYTPVTFKKSLRVGEYKAGQLTSRNEEEEPIDDKSEYIDDYDEQKEDNEHNDLNKNEKNNNLRRLQETSTTVNPVFEITNYLPAIKVDRGRNLTKVRKHNHINSKQINPSAYMELTSLPPTPNPTTLISQNELQQITKSKEQNEEKLQEPIIEYSNYEVDEEPKTAEKALPKKRVVLIKHTSTRAPEKYIDYSDYDEVVDISSTTTEIPRVKIRIRNKHVESVNVEQNNEKHPEAAEEEENHNLKPNEQEEDGEEEEDEEEEDKEEENEEEDTHEDTSVTPDFRDVAIQQENVKEKLISETERNVPVKTIEDTNENENDEDDKVNNESPRIIEKSPKKRKSTIRIKSRYYENGEPDPTTKKQETPGDEKKLMQFVPLEAEIVQIMSRKAPSETTTHKNENPNDQNTSRMIVSSRPKSLRRRIKIRRKPPVKELNQYNENSEQEVLRQTKPHIIKSEKLQLFRDKELAKNVNDLEDKSITQPKILPNSDVEIIRADFQMNDGPKHGGNYRSAPDVEATMKTSKNLELKEDDLDILKKLHGGNLKRKHDDPIERSAKVLNGFASAMPILTTTPIYIEDPAERMYYFVDS